MADLNKLGLADARDALRKGDVTSAELTAACLSAIEGAGALNAFVHHTGDLAMDQAKAADARIKSGDVWSALRHQGSVLHKRGAVASGVAHS